MTTLTCVHCGATVPAGAHFCSACAAPVEAVATGEERKLATVLFADLVGSTALAGAEDPERIRALLDRFYDTMAAEIERAGGTVGMLVGGEQRLRVRLRQRSGPRHGCGAYGDRD